MGRGRVELKRIENKINRQVTFSNTRNGLLKKALEFGSAGITKMLERYQRCSYTPHDNNNIERETQSWYHEVTKLKTKYESLQRTQSKLMVMIIIIIITMTLGTVADDSDPTKGYVYRNTHKKNRHFNTAFIFVVLLGVVVLMIFVILCCLPKEQPVSAHRAQAEIELADL